MKRAAIAALVGGLVAIAGGVAPVLSAPLVRAAPVVAPSAVQKVAIVYKRDRRSAKARGKYRGPARYHSWSRKWWKQHLHSRKYVGEKYHRNCDDWHRCHYYFYGYLQWQKWNPGGSRSAFMKRYHHY